MSVADLLSASWDAIARFGPEVAQVATRGAYPFGRAE